MTARILLPTPLRPYAGQQAMVEVEAATVGDALQALVERHRELRRHLYDDEGKLRRFVNVFKNEEDVRHLGREATPLAPGDTLSIVPSIAGGNGAGAPPQPGARRPPAWATG